MATDMIKLTEALELLARPGIKLKASPDAITMRIVSRGDPSVDLLVYRIAPRVDDLAPHEEAIIQGFDALSGLVGEMIERTDMRTMVPLNFKQDIFNRGILMNPHGLLDVLNFKLTHIETDTTKWRDA